MKNNFLFTVVMVMLTIPLNIYSQWSLTGNSGTIPGTNFLGTTDNQRLVFKTNNSERLTILENGNIGFGLVNPAASLEITTTTSGFASGYNNSFRLNGAAPAIQLWDTENVGWQIGEEHGHLYFGNLLTKTSMGAYRLALLNNGNIGIGTITPISKLNVNGIVSVTGGAGSELLGGEYSGIQLVGGYSTPVSGRMIIGDNTGWKFNIATRDDQSVITDIVTFMDNGNMGLGLNNPAASLEITTTSGGFAAGYNNSFRLNGAAPAIQLWDTENVGWQIGEEHGHLYFGNLLTKTSLGGYRLALLANGNVGIGTITPQAKLAVNGDIFSKKIKVTQTGWPDYVFHPSYSLLPLSELEKFINTYHRLPEVPSAAAIEKDGLDLGETQAVLLKKIEELTLYMIKQQKEIDALKKKMNDRVDTCTSDCCRK